MLLINPARSTSWMLSMNIVIPGGKSIDITPWIQSFKVPDVSLSAAVAPHGPGMFKVFGDTPQFESLNIRFILDENWEILTILYGNLFAQSRAQYHKEVTGSCTVFALDTYNVPRFKLEFSNIVITNVQAPEFTTDQQDDSFTVNATFEYSGARFVKIGTQGIYKLGTGPETQGMYKADGIGPAEIYKNDAEYKQYEGILLRSDRTGEPWKLDFLGDNFVTVLATTNEEQPLEGTCGISSSRV